MLFAERARIDDREPDPRISGRVRLARPSISRGSNCCKGTLWKNKDGLVRIRQAFSTLDRQLTTVTKVESVQPFHFASYNKPG